VKIQQFAMALLLMSLEVSLVVPCLNAQDAAVANPGMVKVEFENDEVRVLRVSNGPHQKGAMHSHPSRFSVTITANNVRAYLPNRPATTSARGAHEYFWSEPVTHQVENLSDDPMQNIEIELKRANRPGVTVKSVSVEPKAPGTAADPVVVEEEPHHHVVFENQYVRVLEVLVKPGETTLFHRHSLENIAVQLSDGTIKRQAAGEDWITAPAKEGSVGFTGGTRTPYVHRIANVGTSEFHVFDVEILP
jgi:quercetin dioxygenase-like cupin family protein